jgi:hypothetical protein
MSLLLSIGIHPTEIQMSINKKINDKNGQAISQIKTTCVHHSRMDEKIVG